MTETPIRTREELQAELITRMNKAISDYATEHDLPIEEVMQTARKLLIANGTSQD